MLLEEFYTRRLSDEGVKFPLEAPDGTQSDEWLVVVGIESARYEKAYVDTMKATVAGADSTEQSNILLASLVTDWSFKEPCTLDNVVVFLMNAPYIKNNLDKFVVERVNFLKKK